MTFTISNTWIVVIVIGYIVGAIGTLVYNLHDMVYISRPLVILRNAVFWPVFLPILIALQWR